MNHSVSVVIPNYNGQKLLEQYLPSVLKAMRNGDEVVVVDDASPDDSVQWLSDTFTLKQQSQNSEYRLLLGKWSVGKKKGLVKVAVHNKNQRYAAASNLGAELASQPYIFLVNTDVKLFPNTLDQLLKNFKDSQVFGVGCYEVEPQATGKPVIGGKNTLQFARGRFIHSRAQNFTSGETAWVSGGSGMFDRAKWLELDGYDFAFKPAYWEDLDISYRAKQKGWKVLFDADAKVEHLHESTNQTALGQQKMAEIGWHHADTFLQKHGTGLQRLKAALWAPYWWIKAARFYSFGWLLAAVVVIGALIRLNQLGQVPHGMTWDEAAIGYNGFSVFTTRRDEWLVKLPLSFRSFGDYKAPLAIYLNGPFTYFLGMTLWAVRLPFALAGVAAIWFMGQLVKTLIEWRDEQHPFERWPFAEVLGIFAAAVLALSPWHVHFSRLGFESGLALTFLLAGCWLIFKAVQKRIPGQAQRFDRWLATGEAISAAVMFAASVYAYHSAKVVMPLLLVGIAVLFVMSSTKERLSKLLLMIGLVAVLCWPLLSDSVWGHGGDRFTQASVISQHGIVAAIPEVATNFILHLTPSFVVGGYTPTLRHGDGHWGVLLPTELLMLVFGLVVIFKPAYGSQRNRMLAIFGLWWLGIGILPAAIGVDVPHPNRALLALPGVIILGALGLEWIWQSCKQWSFAANWLGSKKETNLVAKSLIGTLILVHGVMFLAYQRDYYTVFAAESASEFSDGYLRAFRLAAYYEPSVDQILVSNAYGQSYIYALFVRRTNPIWYQGGALNKYLFTDSIHESDRDRQNTLILATPGQIQPQPNDKLIYGSDGKLRFIVVLPKRSP